MTSLAFVSAPGGSYFMRELLAAVADAVVQAGGAAHCVSGRIGDFASDDTVCVIVPHEYFVLTPPPDPLLLRRTIGFGVEHPGTATFETSARYMADLAGSVQISATAVEEMRRRGVRCERFTLGYTPLWDRRDSAAVRDVDVAYLGTADEQRLGILARAAVDLVGLRTELLLPPHEPMTRVRPDFLIGEAKWQLLARSRLLLNLHREGGTAFEWVRALEAICNGCVVLTVPSTGLDPLVPGEHVLVSDPSRIGRIARAALRDPDRLDAMAQSALQACQALDMAASAAALIALAEDVGPRAPSVPVVAGAPVVVAGPGAGEAPLAEWVPCVRPLPEVAVEPQHAAAVLLRRSAAASRSNPRPSVRRGRPADGAELDVICVRRAGDGPLARTLDSLTSLSIPAAVFVASDGEGDLAAGTATELALPAPVGRGMARNLLLGQGSAPCILVLDAGDELVDGWVADAVVHVRAGVRGISYPLATLGSQMLVNVLVPEARRLARFPYLSRGYVVHRSLLESLGGYSEDLELEDYVDHDFWRRAVASGADARLQRSVGVRLWEQRPELGLRDLDPAAVLARL